MVSTWSSPEQSIIIVCDNKAAIDVIHNPGVTKRTAHYDRRVFFAREAHLNRKAKFVLVKTDVMMADGLTKVVDRSKFFTCRAYLLGI